MIWHNLDRDIHLHKATSANYLVKADIDKHSKARG